MWQPCLETSVVGEKWEKCYKETAVIFSPVSEAGSQKTSKSLEWDWIGVRQHNCGGVNFKAEQSFLYNVHA